LCRALHFFGTLTGVIIAVYAVLTMHPLWLLAAPVAGYGASWIGHFFVEKNRPATFTYPLWSFRGDFKMLGLMLRGRLWSGDPLTQPR
jgi:hypothetical protein